MFDWDDIRIFLATARNGSVRGAARHLDITHATVSRRLRGLEKNLGSQLFERTGTGQVLSPVGHSILAIAEKIEENIGEIDRRAFAQDRKLAGKIRLSISDSLFLSVVRPILIKFQERYPMIELEVDCSDQMSNLGQREADIVVRLTKTPPDTAYGRKIAQSHLACFGAPRYLANRPHPDRWVSLIHKPAYEPVLPARRVITVNSAVIGANLIRDGVGIGLLPCYLGDADPELRRVPGVKVRSNMELWVLVHADMRTTPRVRVLLDQLYQSLEECKDRIEARQPILMD